MAEGSATGEQEVAAGDFSLWLGDVQAAIRGERDSEVPCGGCTACCTSSQFVHVGPDEVESLSRIPAELLFPAPGWPRGHVLLGYDERGHCPMLRDEGCSIYEHRPRTCRAYDCRIFPAAGVEVDADDDDKVLIARRAGRWRFSYPTSADTTERRAVRAAAAFLERRRGALAAEAVPTNATQLAILAIRIHGAFLGHDDTGERCVVEPEPAAVGDLTRVGLARRG